MAAAAISGGYRLRLESAGVSAVIPKGVQGGNGGEHCLLPKGVCKSLWIFLIDFKNLTNKIRHKELGQFGYGSWIRYGMKNFDRHDKILRI